MSCVTRPASPVLKSIWRIGTRVAKEKMLSMAERMLKTTLMTRYFLYGGTKRRRMSMNSRMDDMTCSSHPCRQGQDA